MLKIEFSYRDEMSHGEWRSQVFIGESVEQCKEVYGLDTDPTVYEYKIDSVEEVK